jgi:hypothetical protein
MPRLRRFLLTLLLAALVALLVWLVMRMIAPAPVIQAVYLPVAEYDVPVQPVPFLPGSEAEFRRLDDPPRIEVHVWDKPQTSENIGAVAGPFTGLDLEGRNTLLFYVQAHSVCIDGVPSLACSDLLRGDERNRITGCYPVAELLGHVQQCKAKLKLVVLDVGYLRSDVRLGFLVDEFPLRLDAEIKKLADPQLWVLLSHGPLEGAHGSYAANASALMHFFVAGLRGEADRKGNDDGLVELAELFPFVESGVASWVDEKSGHRESQRAVLLHGGQGIVSEPPPGLTLTRVTPATEKADATGKNPPTAAEAKEPSKTASGGGQKERPAQPDAKPDAKPDAIAAKGSAPASAPGKPAPSTTKQNAGAAAADTAKPAALSTPAVAEEPLPAQGPARVRALLDRAWRARDRLAERSAGIAWTPVDYAPHLWRQYQETLLGYELRFRYGYALAGQRLVPLEELASTQVLASLSGDEPTAAGGASSLLARMTAARRKFAAEGTAQAFASRPELRGLAESVHLRDELCDAAAYYVRWHARAIWLADDTLPLYGKLLDLLGTELPQLVAAIEQWGAMASAGPVAQRDVRMRMADLAEKTQRLRDLREKIERGVDGLNRQADESIQRYDPRRLNAYWPEELLSTPLLAGAVRARLLDRLIVGGPSFDLPARQFARPEPPAAARRWERLAEQANLEVLLARLADPKVPLTTYPQAAPDAFAAPRPGAAEQRLWATYRQLGKTLRDFYQSLPAEVETAYDAADKRGRPRASRLLRFVDARDGVRIPEKADYVAPLPPLLEAIVESKLAVTSDEKRLTLPRTRQWVEWTPKLLVVPAPREKVTLTLSYPAERIEVVERETNRAIPSGESYAVAIQSAEPGELAYRIRAKGDLGWRRLDLVVRAQAEAMTAECKLEIALPLPDRVDLVAQRLVDLTGRAVAADLLSGGSGTGAGGDRCRCDVFPHRRSEYLFRLKNASEEAKKVDVQLWVAPAEATARDRFPLGPYDQWGKTLPGFRLIAVASGLSLPAASAEPVLVPFTTPKAALAAAKKEPVAAAPAEKKDEPRISIATGLVCVIKDATAKDPKKPAWIKWIDFWPVSPRRYLEPKVSFQAGRIYIAVTPLAADWLPVLTPDAPIVVEWDKSALPDPSLPMKTSAKIAAANEQAVLFAELPRDFRGQVPVRLAVDQYPRAFTYEVRCDRAREDVRPELDLREIRFLSPKERQAFRAPLDSLPVELAVDAPSDAFQNPDDAVEVWLSVREDTGVAHDRVVLRSDRQWSVDLEEITPEGFLRVRAEASDFRLGLDPMGIRNAEVDVRAQLRVRHSVLPPKSVRVLLDGSEPEIVRLETPREPVPRGEEATVEFEARDSGSGVKKIEIGIDLDHSGALEEKEKLQEFLAPNTVGPRKVKIDTKPLGPGREFPVIVRATDYCGFTKSRTAFLRVGEPLPPPSKTEEPKPESMLSSIQGHATTGTEGLGWPKLDVRIPELGRSAEVDKQSGRFTFDKVPQGTYKIIAEGWYGNRVVKGETQVTVKAEPAQVEVPMK